MTSREQAERAFITAQAFYHQDPREVRLGDPPIPFGAVFVEAVTGEIEAAKEGMVKAGERGIFEAVQADRERIKHRLERTVDAYRQRSSESSYYSGYLQGLQKALDKVDDA
jgi:hypothetical protein